MGAWARILSPAQPPAGVRRKSRFFPGLLSLTLQTSLGPTPCRSLPGVPGKSRGELQRGRETTRWADLAPWHPGTSALVQIRHEPPAAAPLCGLSHACGHRVALRRMTVPSFAGSRALPFRRSRALVTGFFWCCTLRKEARLADRMQEWGGTGGSFGAGLRPSRYVQ